MGIKVLGPLFSWCGMFAIGILIKWFAFKNNNVWFDIAPEATLWATGVLFTIAVGDVAFLRAKVLSKYTRKPDGIIGYEMVYDVTLPEAYEPTAHSKYVYFFLGGLVGWIFNIFISGFIASTALTWAPQTTMVAPPGILTYIRFIVLILLSFGIAGAMVYAAVRTLTEVSK